MTFELRTNSASRPRGEMEQRLFVVAPPREARGDASAYAIDDGRYRFRFEPLLNSDYSRTARTFPRLPIDLRFTAYSPGDDGHYHETLAPVAVVAELRSWIVSHMRYAFTVEAARDAFNRSDILVLSMQINTENTFALGISSSIDLHPGANVGFERRAQYLLEGFAQATAHWLTVDQMFEIWGRHLETGLDQIERGRATEMVTHHNMGRSEDHRYQHIIPSGVQLPAGMSWFRPRLQAATENVAPSEQIRQNVPAGQLSGGIPKGHIKRKLL